MAASVGEHARLAPGMLIQNRYEVIAEVGCGNFSKVYKCRDTKAAASATAAGPIVAVKVVKKEYANDASFEQEMLRALGAKDPSNAQNVSKMHDFFVWNRFPCFVMPLRGPSLRTRKLGIAKGNTTRGEVVRFAREMLRAIAFSSFTARIVHTDLKPENILLTNAGASSTNSDSDGGGLGSGWMVCDWGSASHWRESRMDSDLISTRPYRAPEAVLGNPWSYPADVWSLGCIIFEAANGSRLFEVHDDNTHLHHMLCRLGALPELLTKRSKHSRKFFDANGNFLRPLGAATSSGASAAAAGPRRMSDALAGEPELLDLLVQMLQFDPSKRIRADDALKHPIFAGFADAAPAEPTVTAAMPAAAVVPVAPVAPAPAAAAKKTAAAAAASETAVQSVVPLRKVNSSPALASAAATPVSTPTGTSAAAAAAAGKFRALPPLVSAAYRLSAPQQPPSSRAIAMASESAASQAAAVRRGSKGPVDKDAAMIAALEKQLAAANIAVAAATADAKENGAYGGAFSAAGGGANAAGSLPNTPPTSAASFRAHHNQQPQPRLIKRPSVVATGGGGGAAGKPSGLLYR